MKQIARNITMAGGGFLKGKKTSFCSRSLPTPIRLTGVVNYYVLLFIHIASRKMLSPSNSATRLLP